MQIHMRQTVKIVEFLDGQIEFSIKPKTINYNLLIMKALEI